jgi:hypothetical protein
MAARLVAGHARERLQELRGLIARGDDPGILDWFADELPGHTALIPEEGRAGILRWAHSPEAMVELEEYGHY